MDENRARQIVQDMLTHVFYAQGLFDTLPVDLRQYELAEMVEANRIFREKQCVPGQPAQLFLDDRMTAALYTITHYPPQLDPEPITRTRNAVLVLYPRDNIQELAAETPGVEQSAPAAPATR